MKTKLLDLLLWMMAGVVIGYAIIVFTGCGSVVHLEQQDFEAVATSTMTNFQGQLKAMDRTAPPLIQNPGIITGTAADSASANLFRQNREALQQRADSLRGVSDQLAGSMSRAAGAVGGGSKTILKPLTESQRTKAAGNPDYKQFLTDKGYKLP